MARIRTIKPEFWASEALGTRLPGPDGRQARLLFIALWNHAEDHGVARGAPALLRSVAFPYDEDVTSGDVSRWLGMLQAAGLVVRYERNGSAYVWVRGFAEHQRLDRPSKTTLPEPSNEEREARASPRATLDSPACETPGPPASPRRALDEPSLLEGKGREGKGEEDPGEPSSAAADPEELPDATDDAQPVLLPVAAAAERPEDLQAAWNRHAHEALPRWREVSAGRRKQALARLRERPLAEWVAVIIRISASAFCRGENDRGWRADPEFLLRPDTAAKVLEGKYDDRVKLAEPEQPKPKMRVM